MKLLLNYQYYYCYYIYIYVLQHPPKRQFTQRKCNIQLKQCDFLKMYSAITALYPCALYIYKSTNIFTCTHTCKSISHTRYIYGGFLKQGVSRGTPTPSIFIGFSIINHPTIGVPPFQQKSMYVEFNLHFSFDVKHNFDTKPPARCARTGEFR